MQIVKHIKRMAILISDNVDSKTKEYYYQREREGHFIKRKK